MTMKAAKIRGEESQGMICAEDELGLGYSHDGIMVLPNNLTPGTPAADYFKPYSDWIYEIGLTPNRMDAMSHMGVAKDVAAYLTHHQKETRVKSPFNNSFKPDNNDLPIKVSVEKAALHDIVETVSANGKVQPEVEVKISADVSGEVVDMFVKEGDVVKKGTLVLIK